MSDAETQTNSGEEASVSFYCPDCRTVLHAPQTRIGEVWDCSECGSRCRVPRPKLSMRGELGVGTRVDEDERPRLSLSGTSRHDERVSVGPTVTGQQGPAAAPPQAGRRWFRTLLGWLSGLAVLSACAALVLVLLERTDMTVASLPEPEDVRPDAELILNTMDLVFQRYLKAENVREVIENDERSLTLLRSLADDTMTDEERIFEESIEQRKEVLAQDIGKAAELVADLGGYRRDWSGYFEDLSEQKIGEAESSGNAKKAQWLRKVMLMLDELPEDRDAASEHARRIIEGEFTGKGT